MNNTLESYELYIINLEEGVVSDSYEFHYDKIVLAHNQGIYLYNNKLAIMSFLRQTINLFDIENGKFMNPTQIGRFCNREEEIAYNSVYDIRNHPPHREMTICSLKHRILVYLYKRADNVLPLEERNRALRAFHKCFDRVIII